jgi:EpsI family protein
MKTSEVQPVKRLPFVLALVVLVVTGVAYRAAAVYFGRSAEGAALPPGALSGLPLRIGEWEGREISMDEAIVRRTDTDALLNRAYTRRAGTEHVGLFLAYGVRARDLMPHRPEVCYPGQGWTYHGTEELTLDLGGGSRLPCRICRFTRGGLSDSEVNVLNYYIVDGEYCPDVSLLRSKGWRGTGSIRYMAQIQIAAPGTSYGARDRAIGAAKDFAIETAQPIRALLPDYKAVAESARGSSVSPAATRGEGS